MPVPYVWSLVAQSCFSINSRRVLSICSRACRVGACARSCREHLSILEPKQSCTHKLLGSSQDFSFGCQLGGARKRKEEVQCCFEVAPGSCMVNSLPGIERLGVWGIPSFATAAEHRLRGRRGRREQGWLCRGGWRRT